MVKRGYANADNSDEDGYRSTKLRKLDPIAQAGRTTQNQTKIHLQFLPDELLLRILSFLTVEDLMKTHRYVLYS